MHRSVLASLVLLGALAARPAPSVAQQGATISGRVTNDAGAPLPNASVFLQGTKVGTLAGVDGRYRIVVPGGQPAGSATLVARLIGYKQSSIGITIGTQSITQDFVLIPSPVTLEGMVVTALGIQRDKRSLGVAQQSVSAPELTEARETNIVNALSGKVAGVEVTATGQEGGSSRIVIRGENSITGNNQPLFVVDGVPIDNYDTTNNGFGGVDYGNTAQDINPNDIESISILKGANAAALYGSRAANGVVVITTKTGKGGQGLGVSASQNFTFETPLRLPGGIAQHTGQRLAKRAARPPFQPFGERRVKPLQTQIGVDEGQPRRHLLRIRLPVAVAHCTIVGVVYIWCNSLGRTALRLTAP